MRMFFCCDEPDTQGLKDIFNFFLKSDTMGMCCMQKPHISSMY